MTYDEFRISVLKASQKKHHFKITNSYWTKDAYRWCITNKLIDKSISEKNFREIINTLNQSLQDRLLKGFEVRLPERMGSIEVRKYKTNIRFENGRLVTNLSVDWDKTLRLWYEDEEAYAKKTLIRCETKERFVFVYSKRKAKYKNKVFYEFTPTRSMRLKLKEKINKQGFEALLLYDKNGLYKYTRHSRQNKEKPTT
jgi:hypothetical protein